MPDETTPEAPVEETTAQAPVEEAPVEDATVEDATVEAPPALSARQEAVLARLTEHLGDAVIESVPMFTDVVARVKPDAWLHVAEASKAHLDCDYLSFISGIDWLPAPKEGDEGSSDTSAPVQPSEMTFGAAGSAGRFQVFAHVQSTHRHWGVTFKADLDESDPRIASWVSVYPGADWHERECREMFGFGFDGHPSLRPLFLPAAFEGHPLRKDFPLLARVVKPWPGLVDVEGMPGEPEAAASEPEAAT